MANGDVLPGQSRPSPFLANTVPSPLDGVYWTQSSYRAQYHPLFQKM